MKIPRFASSVSILVLFLLMLITSISATPALAHAGKITENGFGLATHAASPGIVHPLPLKGVYGHNGPSNCPPNNSYYLASAAVVSANDVWAVGYSTNSSGALQTLTEQWNGTKWSVVLSAE